MRKGFSVVFIGMLLALLALPGGSLAYPAPGSGTRARARVDNTGWAWHIEAVDSAGDVGQYTSLAFAADGTPHIAYYAAGDLKHAYISGTVWVSETVDITGDVGTFASIALTAAGRIGIAYYDATGEDLKYWDSAGQWSGVVDSTGNVGRYAALLFDTQGYPHISYYDATNGNLKYANRNTLSPFWQLTVVDGATADVGRYTSIALIGSSTAPAISYYDVTGGNLKYAWWNGSSWAYTVVDSQGDVGQWTALDLDSLGIPNITYTTGGTTLKHAWREGPVWQTETVSTDMQGYNSLALDAQGHAHVSYQQDSQLRYAYYDGTAWQYETVDTAGEVGAYNSLALDHSDYPHISYRDATNFDLKYAYACCDARFSATPQPQCVAQPVQFWNTSRAQEPLSYLWAFGDGETSTAISPTHSYPDAGRYTAWLTATAGCGVDTMSALVVISSTPEAGFSYGPQPVCAATTVQFTNTTVASPTVTYLWASDDGWSSTLEHPTHTFALPGNYEVVLIATNGCGLDTVTQGVQAHGAPQGVTPTWTPQPPEVGNVVTFTGQASSTLPVESWDWVFGDGTAASGEVVTHTYAATGTYTVQLTAANTCAVGDGQAAVTVVCYPVASPGFTWEPVSPTLGFPTTFSATVGGGTNPVNYEWDFGDGQPGAGAVVEHTYAATGTYSVVLTATNYCGQEEVTHAVVVVARPQAGFTSNAPVCYGQTVVFTNTSGGAEPLTFRWAFGDGITSTLRNPTYTYNTGGRYTVTLTATNPYGEAETSAAVLVVDGVTTADFSWEPAWPAPGQPVTLTATTNGTAPVVYEWSLGDGVTATARVVVHTYATTASYTVTLQAHNACGGESVEHVVAVAFCSAPSGLTAAYTPTLPTPGATVFFTASLTAGSEPRTIAWDFGDGAPWGYGAAVTHTYAAPGVYTASVAAWNACGYVGPVSQQVDVHFPAHPGYVYIPLVYKGYCADSFEPDNTAAEARPLALSVPQSHNFSPEGDEDWTQLSLTAGQTYRFWTSDLTGSADTRLYLYQQGLYGSPVAQNDDWATGNCGGTPADPKQSCFDYTPSSSGVYVLKTNQYTGGAVWGCAVGYVLTATQQ